MEVEERKEEAEKVADRELKVVIHLKSGCALVGVQRKDTDPVVERVDSGMMEEVLTALPGIIRHALDRWAQSPRNPASKLPPPPPPPVARTAQSPRAKASPEGSEGAMQRLI